MMKQKILLITLLMGVSLSFALQGGSVQPDYLQFEPADMQDLVSMQTGDFAYSLPLGDVPGPYGSYPLSISYHAGVTPQQEATWVGLGWSLNPGVINRDVRGVPDDQFHGGTLGFIYQYSALSTWSVDMGWSMGFFNIGTTYNSDGTVDHSVTLGKEIKGVGRVGFTVASHEYGFSASVGKEYGVQVSLMYSSYDDYEKPHVSLGAYAGSTVRASAGANFTSGKKTAYSVGFSAGGEQSNRVGITLSSSGVRATMGNFYVDKNGWGVTVNGGTLSVTNASGDGNNSSKTIGFTIIIPTYAGIATNGYHQSIYEYWLRHATSEYVYGYMYQAGPAIVSDGNNNITGMPDARSASRNSSSSVPWTWAMMGRTMEYMGNQDLHPAYDIYSVASEGVFGTFRPFGAEEHQLYKKISDKKVYKSESVQEYSYLLREDTTNSWQYVNEFETLFDTAQNDSVTVKTEYPSYDYCVNDSSCSPYALYKTRFLNEGNRLVYRINKDGPDTVRSRMNFLFIGEGKGYYESEALNEGKNKPKNELSSKLLKRTLDDYDYALYGSRKIEPIFEDNRSVGKLTGFVITSSDGSKYYFQQPVRSFLKADYSINREKGVPIFYDKSGDKSENFLENMWDGITSMGRWTLKNLNPYIGTKETYKFFFSSGGKLASKCTAYSEESGNRREDYFYSYQINMNPHATQWLLTEIQGADFIKLGDSIQDNIGLNIKFHYTEPALYRWRTPYTRPNLPMTELPNFRQPKNGLTPEGCDARMYQASFGVKEYVYLESIESGTHKAVFKLNDPLINERVDGKGWELASDSMMGEIPIWVQSTVAIDVDTTNAWTLDSVEYGLLNNKKQFHYWKKIVAFKPTAVYVNSKLPENIIKSLVGKKLIIGGFDRATVIEDSIYLVDSTIYNLTGMQDQTLNLQIDSTSSGNSIFEETSGEESKLGLYKIHVSLDLNSHVSAIYVRNCLESSTSLVYCLGRPRDTVPSKIIMGENGNYYQNPMINWGNFIWAKDSLTKAENQMRYLEQISFYNKTDTVNPYRQFIFGYNYSLHPKTPNSYCSGYYPDSLSDLTNSPNVAPLNVCANDSNRALYGKLTLNSITEKACQNGQCASLPPFQFSYLSPSATSFRLSSKLEYIATSQGVTDTTDTSSIDGYGDLYYELLTDVDASIISTSNAIDDWGFWNQNANSENRKVTQQFADYGAAAWSLNKVTDPAGGILEIEYERDRYGHGEDYSNEKKYAEFAGFGQCSEFSDDGYSIADSNASRLCLELGKLYWREQCLGTRVAFWDTLKPAGFTGTGFEYLDEMNFQDTAQTLYFNLKTNISTKVKCGLFGIGHCPRTRSVALFGDGKFIDSLSSQDGTRRLLILERNWENVAAGINRAGQKIADKNWSIDNGGSRMGFLWARQSFEEMKGGDLRVSRLTRHDIGITQQTEYEYAPGEMGQLPDSAFNTVLGSRFYASKITYALPDIDLIPKSRVVGIGDDDLYYIPGSRITYPTVTVRNTDGNGNTENGYTEFKYVTPETGIPREFVDSVTAAKLKPFLKINTILFKLNAEALIVYDWQIVTDIPRGRIVNFTLLDSLQNAIANQKTIVLYEGQSNSVSFYADSIRNVRYLKVKTIDRYSTLQIFPISESLSDFNELTLSMSWGLLNIEPELEKVWFRKQEEGYYPIIYRKVEYVQDSIHLSHVDNLPKFSAMVDFESSVTYHDLTAFLGLNYKVSFYRGNDNRAIPINVGRSVFSTIVPDVLENVATGVSSDSVRTKLGRQVERWHYDKVLSCNNYNKGESDNCKENYRALYEKGNDSIGITSKNFTYIRYPAFQVGSITYTGYDHQQINGTDDYMTRSTLENHRYDPLTGTPTVTLARSSLGHGKEMRKITQITPHYMLSENADFANEMFYRNMLTQKYLEALYTGTVDTSAAWNSIMNNHDSLRSASVNPYRFLDIDELNGKKKPILAWGTYTIKDPSDFTGTAFDDLFAYQKASDSLPSLTRFNGTHIRTVDRYFKVREMEDAWGRTLTSHYSADGMYQTGLFFPATLAQTAQVVPNQKSIAIENCTVTGSGYSVNPASGGIHASGTVSLGCTLSTTSFVAEYRIKRASTGKWETLRQQPATNLTSFALTLNNGDVLNYLRVYPGDAEAKTYLYDSYGNLVQVVAEDNTSTYYEYDPLGKLLQVRDDDGVSFKSHWREFMNDDRDTISVTSGN